MKTFRTDLDDYKCNSADGIHAANMAGSWIGLIYGFAGLRITDGLLTFKPKTHDQWDSYAFNLIIKDMKLHIKVKENQDTYELVKGETLSIKHYDQFITLEKHAEVIEII